MASPGAAKPLLALAVAPRPPSLGDVVTVPIIPAALLVEADLGLTVHCALFAIRTYYSARSNS